MFWFAFKKATFDIGPASTRSLYPIHNNRPELKDLLANDAQIRIWLPEPLRLAMDHVANHLETTLSKYLREYFVDYLYGTYALVDMHNNQTGIFYKPPKNQALESNQNDIPMFSRTRSIEFIPGLGKNIVPFKVFLNAQIKSDLQLLADKAEMALSQFIREILASHFLGHTVWPERQQMFNAEHISIANQWESGDLEADLIRAPSDTEEARLEGKVEYLHL